MREQLQTLRLIVRPWFGFQWLALMRYPHVSRIFETITRGGPMRIHLTLLLTLMAGSPAQADVSLTAKRINPTTVELDWTSGTPSYGVYRSTLPSGVASPGNFLSLTGATSYVDGSAAASALFYLVSERACVGDADCPPTGNACADAVCSSHACTNVPKPFGYVLPNQTIGDCRDNVCDGAGNVVQSANDTDVPNDNNSCTTDVCKGGTPAYLNVADGHPCADGEGSECETGVCMPTVSVLRVGDGTASLGTSATAAIIERRKTDGTVLGTVTLPVAVNGSNQPCTLAGSATSEGRLMRSPNASYLTLAGYAAVPGVLTVASTATSIVNRVVCRVDAAGNVDSTTRLTTAFSGSDVRGAVTNDGSSFWVSGNSTGSSGGVWYVPLGVAGGLHVLSTPNDVRSVGIFGGQLYADTPVTNVFTVGSGLPTTTGQTATTLPGLPTTNAASPDGFALFDLNPNVSGVDTLYLADDRGLAMGGGIQKWTFDGVTWTQVTTFNSGITTGLRALAAVKLPNGTIGLFATTVDATNSLVRFIDDFVHTPTATVLATAPNRFAFRGVAISPR